jgi:hypothetical protein
MKSAIFSMYVIGGWLHFGEIGSSNSAVCRRIEFFVVATGKKFFLFLHSFLRFISTMLKYLMRVSTKDWDVKALLDGYMATNTSSNADHIYTQLKSDLEKVVQNKPNAASKARDILETFKVNHTIPSIL